MWEVDGTGSLSFAVEAYMQLAELKIPAALPEGH
jgi:hypothetical protein